ncbi:hypothetical protein EUGRSUZ_A01138 [Eucalyptus grandis]|uniref:Uncharacterized protein n=2 Tax=Eucalyptus grandis TaxID=71139 RepID=A0ACC3M2M7_EUCGR|nr:hypothetical protein EUGRSUZ_A01138 [Eucalyptus grandis]
MVEEDGCERFFCFCFFRLSLDSCSSLFSSGPSSSEATDDLFSKEGSGYSSAKTGHFGAIRDRVYYGVS